MSATLIKGKPIADRIRAQVADDVAAIGHIGLVTVLVGDDPASDVYIRLKHKAAVAAGIDATDLRLPEETSERELLAKVEELDADPQVDAILVQLPLPRQIDEAKVIRALAPAKDVDGFHPINAGQLYLGEPTLVPATPRGVMAMLAEHDVELSGARAVVIGRSAIVGKPMAHLLLQQNATVTICHSRTKDLARHTLEADVLVAAVGVPGMVTPDMVRPGGVVIDVGINRTDDGIVGDVDPGAAEVAGYVTPVPGGVGPMTIACLLENAVRCARYRRGELAYPG
ncbi:MAG TPA: bifunctional 5,10-methylenetetrahydrofolate dehydrogenase/5,10-methenyltetrahydrofolate cyclohydrolase [Gaiellaceae bacterium]|jgi:methylenetetrahydrofolate dehydrogenase (NADP+) / methenyltetrahydrofolate cyclohydrolase|nr:bifunctional 5,10-methylenetetrahydrofolate dehydrogenase/5,10-methenyltetrahydrofolate cyclohydrolase [Gaiellaceae bacterium]